jgi:hypothetical protein
MAALKKGITRLITPLSFSGRQDPRLDDMKMFTKIFSIEDLKESANFVIKEFKDSVYFGEVDPDTNERSGLGIITYGNGRHYEGSWLNDKREGTGFERFSNGNTY